MAIVYGWSSTIGQINGNSVTTIFPASSVLAGDTVVLFGGHPNRASTNIGPVSVLGYTVLATNEGASPNFGAWYKYMGSTPDASVAALGTGNVQDGTTYGVYVLRGVTSIVSSIKTTVAGPTTGTNPAPASIITAENNSWVLALAGSEVADTAITSILGYSSLLQASANDNNDISIGGNLKPIAAAGTESPGTYQNWSSGAWYAATVAFQPQPASIVTTFMEPGGDADFLVGTTNGFWSATLVAPTIATDFVHGGHQKSIKYAPGANQAVDSLTILTDLGSRISLYVYFNVLPSATSAIISIRNQDDPTIHNVFSVQITSAGVLQLWNGLTGQIGTDGDTLSTGTWYRISVAYTITSTSVNRFEVFVDGNSSISVTDATLTFVNSSGLRIGNISTNANLDFRSSDHYIDNGRTLTDPGDIWVTAKRPNANGTTNDFSTQIGSGGSGYGTGHSPQVNERPLDTANGWSVVAVAATTEEYNIESTSTGDIDISTGTIKDYMGWVSAKALVSETGQIIVNNVNSNISLTSTIKLFKKIASSTTYPAGTGTDIGMITSATATTVSLYECGVVVAFIPGTPAPEIYNGNQFFQLTGAGT